MKLSELPGKYARRKIITYAQDHKDTANYSTYKSEMLSSISLGDLIRMENMISALCDLLPQQTDLVEEATALVEDVGEKLAIFRTGTHCP